MRLTWRDLGSTVVMAAIIVLYAVHVGGADGWIVSSTRGTAGAVLALGMVGCALGKAEELYGRDRPREVRALAAWLSGIGLLALAAAVIGIASGDGTALALLVSLITALWLTATLRHAYDGSEVSDEYGAPEAPAALEAQTDSRGPEIPLTPDPWQDEETTESPETLEAPELGPRTHEVIDAADTVHIRHGIWR